MFNFVIIFTSLCYLNLMSVMARPGIRLEAEKPGLVGLGLHFVGLSLGLVGLGLYKYALESRGQMPEYKMQMKRNN